MEPSNPLNDALWEEVITVARSASDHYSMTEEQQRVLFDIYPGGTIVELGVCNGKTALVLAAAAWSCGFGYLKRCPGRYIGIDNWGLENTYEGVKALMEAARLWGGNSYLINGSTHTPHLPDSLRPIDLLVIDAGHDEANVSIDCERWTPMVRPGGYVAFHDYDEPADPDSPHWAVRHYADKYTGSWKHVGYWDGLLIRQRPV